MAETAINAVVMDGNIDVEVLRIAGHTEAVLGASVTPAAEAAIPHPGNIGDAVVPSGKTN